MLNDRSRYSLYRELSLISVSGTGGGTSARLSAFREFASSRALALCSGTRSPSSASCTNSLERSCSANSLSSLSNSARYCRVWRSISRSSPSIFWPSRVTSITWRVIALSWLARDSRVCRVNTIARQRGATAVKKPISTNCKTDRGRQRDMFWGGVSAGLKRAIVALPAEITSRGDR